MVKLVDKSTNKVEYGIFDQKIEFNWDDYQLNNFWDKPIGYWRRKFAFHKFHFVAINNAEYIIGLAIVDVSVGKNIFGYVYQKNVGLVKKWQKQILNRYIKFTNDIDHNQITYHSKSINFDMQRDFDKGTIQGTFTFKNQVSFTYTIDLSLENKPLRVVNPIDFDHWSYTEKRAGLKLTQLNLTIEKQPINFDLNETFALVDWSSGYFRRSTNWAWGCAGTKVNQQNIGFNFAIFHNNALFPENAIWLDNEREHIHDILFKYDYKNPYENGVEIYTADDRIHLYFKPLDQMNDVHTRVGGLVKTNFRQFFGVYKGHITINNKLIVLPEFLGLLELHKALW